MEQAKELILQAVYTIIFYMAIILLSHYYQSYHQLLDRTKSIYFTGETMYESKNVSLLDVVLYQEMIAILCDWLEYDLEINGLLISKYEHTPDQVNNYNIAKTDYRKEYAYDSNGNVTRIIYTSV